MSSVVTVRMARCTLLVALGAALGACASNLPVLKSESKPDDGHGVVFGRMLASVDGMPITKDPTPGGLFGMSPHVKVFISPFEGVEKLHNVWAAGKWAVDAQLQEGGYFSTILPVGRYYLVEFQFWDLTSNLDMAAVRTYVSGGPSWTTNKPNLLVFEVLPGRSTYLGTLTHVIHSQGNRFAWGTKLLDESTEATGWFNTRYPQLADVGVRLLTELDLPSAGLTQPGK